MDNVLALQRLGPGLLDPCSWSHVSCESSASCESHKSDSITTEVDANFATA
jgi:hypothetical protein